MIDLSELCGQPWMNETFPEEWQRFTAVRWPRAKSNHCIYSGFPQAQTSISIILEKRRWCSTSWRNIPTWPNISFLVRLKSWNTCLIITLAIPGSPANSPLYCTCTRRLEHCTGSEGRSVELPLIGSGASRPLGGLCWLRPMSQGLDGLFFPR